VGNVDFSLLIGAEFVRVGLVALTSDRLPAQVPEDLHLLNTVGFLAYRQMRLIADRTPGSRFKKDGRPWQRSVLATCTAFTLGEAMTRGVHLTETNTGYVRGGLEGAHEGTGALLDPREWSARCAYASEVLENGIVDAGIKRKKLTGRILIVLPAAWLASIESMDEFGLSSAEYMRSLV
jgi:hypothetical protein